MPRFAALILALAAQIWFLPVQAQEAKLPVVASFSILGDMVRQIGGDAVTVRQLVGPGEDAHVYQPRPADVKMLSEATLVVVNGLGLEGWMERLIRASGYHGITVISSEGINPASMKSEAGKSLADPHAWQDLKNAEIYIRNIEQGLVQVDPARAALYHQRAEAYRAQVMALDNWVREQIAKVPVDQRKIITSHDAFGYFGRAYGIRFLAPAGLSTESEPTAAQIGKLIKQIKLEGIKALFIENMTNPRLIDMLAKETGAFVGGTLYSDSLSLDGGEADSYLKMFDHNVPLLIKSMKLN